MHQEGLLLTFSSHIRNLRLLPHRCTHPLRGCQGRPMCHLRLQQSSGVTCGAATNIYKETCAGGNYSPSRNSFFALTRMEMLMAPKVRTIHTVSQLPLTFNVYLQHLTYEKWKLNHNYPVLFTSFTSSPLHLNFLAALKGDKRAAKYKDPSICQLDHCGKRHTISSSTLSQEIICGE